MKKNIYIYPIYGPPRARSTGECAKAGPERYIYIYIYTYIYICRYMYMYIDIDR